MEINRIIQNSVQHNYLPELYPLYPQPYKKMPPSPPCMDCPTPSPKPFVWGKSCRQGENSAQKRKNAHFPHQKNPPHQTAIKSFIYSCSHCCCIMVLTSGFMYRYIMIILICRLLLNLICTMIKTLNGRNSSTKISNPFLHLSMLLENTVSIIDCFPFYSFPFSFQTL